MNRFRIIVTGMSVLFLAHIAEAQVGSNWTEVTSAAAWGARADFGAVAFNGSMWVLGGFLDSNPSIASDVWSSPDGINWTEITSAAPWGPRALFGAFVFNGKMWVLGGYNGNLPNDVWSSPDGTNWTEVTPAAPWSGRALFGAVVFNGIIWVMGGSDLDGDYFNDVWSSGDGTNWTEVSAGAPWSGRFGLGAVAFNGSMWILGGYHYDDDPTDVWSTPDGLNWTQVTNSAPWNIRYEFEPVAFDHQIWVLGGYDENYLDDVWSSPDGTNWTEVTPAAQWSARSDYGALAFNGSMWMLGGDPGLNDVWASTATPPVASFTAVPTNGFAPLWVTFTDTSSGLVTNWFWDFGDGSTTNLTTLSVAHQYITGEIYTVTEIVTGPSGVSTSVQPNYITVAGCPSITPPPPPAISVNPTSLSEAVTQGQDAPNQMFGVLNPVANCSLLTYSISSSAPWLSVSPTNGASAGLTVTHTVVYSTASLTAGLYNAALTISSPDATNSPQTIPVSLTVLSLVVSNTNDSGPGSLRQAILNANTGGGGIILLSNATGTITLTSGELVISNNISILGPGPANLAISGNSAGRVFTVSNATANISDLTIQNGSTNAPGGALYNLGSLVLSNCIITGNSSLGNNFVYPGIGGGIYNGGTMALVDCTVTNNFASSSLFDYGALGGGIYNAGVLTLDSCAISGNSCEILDYFEGQVSPSSGGGIYNANALMVNNCSINNNSVAEGSPGCSGPGGPGGVGGGVYNTGTVTIMNSTANGNSAGAGGSGLCNLYSGGDGGNGGGFWNEGSLFMTGCTVCSNSAGAGGEGTSYDYQQFGGDGGSGGGVYNLGTLALTNCTIVGNVSGGGGDAVGGFFGSAADGGNGGSGGGIANSGVLTAVNCTVYGNSTGSGGSGAYGFEDTVSGGEGGTGGSGGGISGGGTLINCTVYGNSTGSGGDGGPGYETVNGGNGGNGGSGGGISGAGTLVNCTISSNSVAQGGSAGGGYGVANNGNPGSPGSGGGIDGSGQLLNSLIASNSTAGSGPDVSGSFTSLGYNLIGTTDSSSSGFGATGDLLNVNPLLGPLTDNGGPTFTCALLPGSPAIDAGTCVGAPPYDQRGVLRPQGAACDIGAFEFVFVCPGEDLCDGIPDSWRAQYFPNQPTDNVNGTMTNGLSCATCDADGTGQDNLFKFLAGLDPTNPSSIFGITAIARESNDVAVTWTCVGGHSYVLQNTRSTAMIAEYSTNFADASPTILASGLGPSTTNYLDVGAAYAPVVTAPGGTMVTISTVPSTVGCSAVWTRGITDSLGNALPIGSLLMLGTFSITEPTIQSNFTAGNLSAIMSNFTPYSTPFKVGDGTSQPASWDVSLSAAGFAGQQIYLLAVDAPTLAAANHLGVFTAPSWIFPADGCQIDIDLDDVTDFTIGAQGGPLTINLVLGGETYTFSDTARLSYLPGRILFYRVRLAE
ncbi:MAG: choice-of-anchor Q domain-containing protein [Verrucomicrobiia bacterium]